MNLQHILDKSTLVQLILVICGMGTLVQSYLYIKDKKKQHVFWIAIFVAATIFVVADFIESSVCELEGLLLPKNLRIIRDVHTVPVLDSTITIGRNYNIVTIGGINLDKIKVNARSESGEKIKLWMNSSKPQLEIDSFFDQPYVELEYDNCYFSIQVESWKIKEGIYYPIYNMKAIDQPTFDLIPVSEVIIRS